MPYEWTAVPTAEVPRAREPVFQHLLDTYASETSKTASVWRAVPDRLLDVAPHMKSNTIRAVFKHQLLSERRFFAEFAGIEEPPASELLPAGETPDVAAYLERYVTLAKRRLPAFAAGDAGWWLAPRPFFGGGTRERIWIFWRRVLHTAHHRTQVQTALRLAGEPAPPIYGPTADAADGPSDPTYSVRAASRGPLP